MFSLNSDANRIIDAISNLSRHVSSANFSRADLLQNSEFRQRLSLLLKAARIIDKSYVAANRPELFLIHHTKPRFLNLSRVSKQQISKDDLVKKLVVRLKNTSDDFHNAVLDGVASFPEKALRLFRRFHYKFLAKHHTTQGTNGELGQKTPNQFDSRTHYDECGGLAHTNKRQLITSEHTLQYGRFKSDFVSTAEAQLEKLPQEELGMRNLYARCKYIATTSHEGGHGLDSILFTFRQVRILNRAKTFEQYLELLQKFKHTSGRDFSSLAKFKKAYMEDISKLSQEEQERLKYFLYQDSPGNYSRGMQEVFAEGTCFLHDNRGLQVNWLTFPQTLKFMLKTFERYIGT